MVPANTQKKCNQCISNHFKLYKGNASNFLLNIFKVISLRNKQTFKERVDKNPEGLAISEDLVDTDVLMFIIKL